jgi:hypothetical protein
MCLSIALTPCLAPETSCLACPCPITEITLNTTLDTKAGHGGPLLIDTSRFWSIAALMRKGKGEGVAEDLMGHVVTAHNCESQYAFTEYIVKQQADIPIALSTLRNTIEDC